MLKLNRGIWRGFYRGFWNPLKFLDTLMKLETYLGILIHKYWNRNHDVGIPHFYIFVLTIGTVEF